MTVNDTSTGCFDDCISKRADGFQIVEQFTKAGGKQGPAVGGFLWRFGFGQVIQGGGSDRAFQLNFLRLPRLQFIAQRHEFIDFGDNAPLLRKGRQRERRQGKIIRRNTFLSSGTCHPRRSRLDETLGFQKCQYVVWLNDVGQLPKHMQFGCSRAKLIWQAGYYCRLPVLKTGSNFCKNNVTVCDMRVAALDINPLSFFKSVWKSELSFDFGHRHKADRSFI